MSPSFRAALAWIVGSLLIVLFALMPLSAAWLNGEYLPSNADAFYHARRALDVAMTGQAVTQFDARIHVPEGSWINWPWAYDSVLGWITRAFGPFASEAAANRVLLKIPVACAPLFIAISPLRMSGRAHHIKRADDVANTLRGGDGRSRLSRAVAARSNLAMFDG